MQSIPDMFLTHASDILGDTDQGLSGNNISEHLLATHLT